MHVKIGDFGFASVLLDPKARKRHTGMPSYMEPEILFRNNGYIHKVDAWSISNMMWIRANWKKPFYELPSHLIDDAKDLVTKVLINNPLATKAREKSKVSILETLVRASRELLEEAKNNDATTCQGILDMEWSHSNVFMERQLKVYALKDAVRTDDEFLKSALVFARAVLDEQVIAYG
ncbi:hypothetical protein BDB00DRAFT_790323 [Zychaea mexicana]|uniref:uncharacterized protein n=1 Tax=Zychaea mexicana TaxID=64656 RepID=UPI0022FEEB54|nr:uncharacterized protein BDB00DRAFT_790323 [Zychaea mexicana]KAI9490420.1 hypothetical protein BDB00DRAFT_790323 [Zychaea mexicana]